ncbi:MAG: transcription elongation factor GreA [Candidatus Woesebacteria bacterium]|jgi:transcription elongation factor GreA
MSDKQQNKQTIELTKEGLEELKEELRVLVEEKLPKVIKRVAAAREQGDLSENSDYQNAKDDQAIIESRIDQINEVLAKAKVVRQTKSLTKVGLGSTVVLYLKGKKNKKFTFQIVGEFESDPNEGKISSVSPLGKALSGKKKGDTVEVEAPAGKITYIVYKIK